MLHCDLGYPSKTEKMLRHRIRAHYKQLSEFERGCIIRLKEAVWQIGELLVIWVETMQPLEESWQEWVHSGKLQRHDGSYRLRATADYQD
ncbi:hypothetical protein TNCV_1204031 [Trichonephila clavipes]|nr:hypothetical protein TNCV_1204031 [Trichonephila clavipes]